MTARAAKAKARLPLNCAAEHVVDFDIGKQDMAVIYMSPSPYHDAFLQTMDLRKFDLSNHATAGLEFYEPGRRLHLKNIALSTSASKKMDCRSCIRGAWLIKVNDTNVTLTDDVALALKSLHKDELDTVLLLFSHPEIRPNLSKDGIPIVSLFPFSLRTHDQLNNRWEFLSVDDHLKTCRPSLTLVHSGEVLNVTTRVMRLTRGKLLKQPDWHEWQESEFLQLDQYDAQGMFCTPVPQEDGMAVFHLVWTYAIKAVDSRKKARWHVMDLQDQDKRKFSIKHTPTAWTKQVPVYFTQLRLQKT
jgi:hypothetical protein